MTPNSIRLEASSLKVGAADRATGPASVLSAAIIQEPQSPPLVTAETTAQVTVEVLPAASTVTAPIEPQPENVPIVSAVQEDAAALTGPVASSPPDEMPTMPDFLDRRRRPFFVPTAADLLGAG